MSACEGKRGFTLAQARDELARVTLRAISGERRAEGQPLESGAYECPACGAWHLTSRPWGGRVLNTLEDQLEMTGGRA